MRLFDAELARYDWSALDCACDKTAVHLPDDLRHLVRARSRKEAEEPRLDCHVLIQSFPQEPAVPVTSVLMAALTEEMSPGATIACLDLLAGLVWSDDEDSEAACQEIARQGLWSLYHQLWTGTSPDILGYAYYILRVIETDQSRLSTYIESGQIRVPPDITGKVFP
ncbi:hypothetical protein [Peterkaempfera sp. SMS 1(5)a]|uniref:hypothetical protein n=1 Tax=Peterkaempfera podocarpi TaxID=3232308 RepID=UPI00366AC624